MSEIENIMRGGPQGDIPGSMDKIRKAIVLDGVEQDSDGMVQLLTHPYQSRPSLNLPQSAQRIYVWSILLGVPPLSTDKYLEIIQRGASPAYSKIRNDTFRTLATDPLFKRRVSEASLIRLLNALAWTLAEPVSVLPFLDSNPPLSTHSGAPTTYVQGMNVLGAPLLYAARSETEAFALAHRLLKTHLPSYITPTLSGVHAGLALVDKCLSLIDPKLAAHLEASKLSASIYAFPSVLTLCACTPPLPEVLMLWDFLFAYGVHLNVLAIVAQLVLMREELLAEKSPGRLLRSFPALKGRKVVEMALSFVGKLDERVYGELVTHTTT